MIRPTLCRPWPTLTTIAPPAPSRNARPAASQTVEPSARTATGGSGTELRRKTRPVGVVIGDRSTMTGIVLAVAPLQPPDVDDRPVGRAEIADGTAVRWTVYEP